MKSRTSNYIKSWTCNYKFNTTKHGIFGLRSSKKQGLGFVTMENEALSGERFFIKKCL